MRRSNCVSVLMATLWLAGCSTAANSFRQETRIDPAPAEAPVASLAEVTRVDPAPALAPSENAEKVTGEEPLPASALATDEGDVAEIFEDDPARANPPSD